MTLSNRALKALMFLLATSIASGSGEAKSVRDPGVVREWRKTHPCPVEGPGTCFQKGYAVDHVIALECGGADSVENLAYFNRESHKLKSKYDNLRCKNTWFGAIMRLWRDVRFWEN